MNELQKLYDVLKRDGYYTKSFEEFQTKWQDKQYQDKVYGVVYRDKLYTKSKDEFLSKYASQQAPLKKKESTVSASKLAQPTSGSSSKQTEVKADVKTPVRKEDKFEVYKGYTGKEDKEYRFDAKTNTWYETKLLVGGTKQAGKEMLSSGATVRKETTPQLNLKSEYVQITNPSRVAELNRYFKKQASTSKGEKIFVGYPGKEANEYKVGDNGVWMKRAKGKSTWSVVTNEGSIGALNRQFGKDVDPKKADLQELAAKNSELNSLNHKIDSYVTSSLVDDREGAVVSVLSKQFPQFKFEEYQAGADKMTVSLRGSNRPEDKITIMLDNWRDSEDAFEAQRLRDFMKERANMADSRINLEKKEGYFVNKETQRMQQAIATGMGERDFVQPELKINKDGSVSYATEPTTKPGETTMKDWEAKQQLMTARKEYIADKSSYMKSLKNSYERGDIDRKQFGSAVAAIKVDDEEIKRHDNFINDVNLRRKDLVQSEKFQQDYIADVEAKLKSGEITQQQYDTEYKDKIAGINQRVEEKRSELKKDDKNVDASLKAMNMALGENRLIQEQIGSTGGVMVYNFLKGATNLGRFAGMTAEDQDEFIRELTGIMTTEEWMASKDRTFLQQAAMSTTSSLGAAATKFIPVVGQIAYAGNLFSLGFFEMKDELDNATYKNPETGKIEKLNIPAEQKLLMSAGFGVVSYYLEKLGLDELLTGKVGKKLAMTVVKDVAKKIAKDSPKEFIENALISETKSRLMQAGVKLGTGMLTEGATESLQSLANVSTKEIYDSLAEKEYFNNKSGWEIASDVLYEGALGAAGGAMVSGAITGTQLTAQQRRELQYKNEINAMIAAAETEGASQAIITTLKAKVIKGELTAPEAKQIATDFTIIKSKIDQMPNDLSEQGKAASLDLMMERDALNKQIEGKDPNLVKPQKDRIAEIDNRLQEIAKENAVQEQSTSEVPVQPTTGVGEQVEERVPESEVERTTGETVREEGQVEQAQTEVAQEERQQLIDAFIQEETNVINEIYATLPQEEKQAALDKLEADPISYAREQEGMPRADNFIKSIEKQEARGTLLVAQPNERFEFTQENLPQELQGVEPIGRTEIGRRGILGIGTRGPKTITLTFSGQQMIDAGLRAAQPQVQPVTEEAVVVEEAPAAATQPMAIPQASVPTRADVTALNKGTLAPERVDSILMGAIEAQEQGKALNKTQQRVVDANQGRVEELVSSRTLSDEVTALSSLIEGTTDGPAFQLQEEDKSNKEKSKERKAKLQEQATALMERIQPEIADEAYDSQEPTKGTVKADIKENQELTKGVPRRSIRSYIGKKMNILMADLLKVDMGSGIKKMGGAFFPLIPELRGKVAWASITKEAAMTIVRGAIKSQISMVYNMNPEAMMSNKVFLESVMERISKLSDANQVFELMMDRIQKLSFGENTAAVHKAAREAKNINEFKQNFGELNVDAKAAIMKSILPESDYQGSGKTEIKLYTMLVKDGISKQSMLQENAEQFASDLPMGALTMALNIVDENGNRPTPETAESFIITQDEAKAMGLPIHENYPFYIKGNVDAILTETAPFWEVLKDFKRSVDAKISNLIQKKDVYTVEREVTDKKGNKKNIDIAVKVYNNPNGTRTVEVFKDTKAKGEGQRTVIDELEKEATDKFIEKNIGKIKDYKKGGLYTAKEARQSTARSASMKAGSVYEITEPTQLKYQQFIEKLSKAFPTVEVVTSQEEFDAMIDEIRENNKVGAKILLKKDQSVYGAVYNGKLYLNPSLENYNTPIHEFGHIWLNVAKTMRADLYNRGLELIRNSEYLEQIKNSPEYSRIAKLMQAQGFSEEAIERYLEEEALATAIGDKGEAFVSAATKRSFNNWLNDVFEFVKKLTGISDVTAEQLQDMTLDDFVQGVVVDLMSENQQFKEAEIESFGSQLQLMTGPSGLTMTQIIHMGRAYGFSDAAIKQTLLNQKFKAKSIDNAMQVAINTVDVMPAAFANVEGGMQVGLDMFNDIQQELDVFARGTTTTTRAPRMTAKERAARIAELRQQNPTLTEISDSELLKRFPRARQAATTTTTRPTKGEVRAKALELLRNHPTFQAQTDTIQMELMSAFDKTLATRANNIIQQQINAIRNNLRQRKIGAKELQDSKAFLRDFIRKALPKSEAYSDKMVNKLLTIIAKSNASTIMRDTDNVLALVEQQREKMKDSVIKDIFAMVSKKAKPGRTITGRRRSAGLDAEGQAFFETAARILKAVIKGDTAFLDAVKQTLDDATNDGSLSNALNKSLSGEKLTSKERDILNKLEAYDMLLNVKDMQLEEVNDLFSVLKGRRTQAIMNYSSNRIQRAATLEKINEEATKQAQALYGVLFTEVTDKDGDVTVRPKTTNELENDKAEVFNFIRNGKIGKAIRAARKNWNFSSPGAIKNFFNNYFKHLGAMMNMLDNKAKGMSFFTENVYNRLNRMDENSKRGYINQMQMLNDIANSISGITKGFRQIRDMVQSTKQYELFVKRGDEAGPAKKNLFSKEELMRMYALSKNATQRAILERQGLTDAKIDEIKNIIGPQAVEFVDKVVEYLSNEYYESVNDVYSSVNDVYLGRVDNYFPTSRVDPNKGAEFNPENPNFSSIFNAETAPSLYERTNSKADIDLGFDFFDVLDNHLQNMERYKAHAQGVKIISSIFQNENVAAILNGTKTNKLIKNLINYAITPNFNASHQTTVIDKIQSKFTGFALAFRAVQILKQATSFVNAFEDYSLFKKNSKVPRALKFPVDLVGFMVDTAYVIATMPKQVKQAYEMSANFKDRVQKGISGDTYILESGSRLFQPIDKRSDKYGKVRRALKTGAAAPTMIGDVLGVMGYMVNYRRNIKNGMSQEKALEAFNNYNATAQSRRATERSTIQNNQHALTRAFTMFGSTTFLQLNKVSMAWKNMWDYMKEGKMPEAKDMRALILNLGVANALFVLTANIAKYALGDDEDRDEIIKEMKKSLLGWNLLLTVPFFNEVFQELDNYINDTKKPVKMGTNPLMSVWYKTKQALKADDVYEAMVPLIELTIGAQLDPAIGLYNIFKGDFDDADIYSTLGISKSYRPSPNEYRTSLLEQGYTEEEADEMVVENNYMKALDKAEKDKQKELDEMYEEFEAGEITESEYDKQYEEVEKEYEEQLNEIDEEYGMK